MRKENIKLIALTGFMRTYLSCMVSRRHQPMVNIHPSLLPRFTGLNTHARALEAGEEKHGCTVHWVSDGVDEGRIIDQSSIDINPDHTEESLASQVLKEEHQLYPRAIASICNSIVVLRPVQASTA